VRECAWNPGLFGYFRPASTRDQNPNRPVGEVRFLGMSHRWGVPWSTRLSHNQEDLVPYFWGRLTKVLDSSHQTEKRPQLCIFFAMNSSLPQSLSCVHPACTRPSRYRSCTEPAKTIAGCSTSPFVKTIVTGQTSMRMLSSYPPFFSVRGKGPIPSLLPRTKSSAKPLGRPVDEVPDGRGVKEKSPVSTVISQGLGIPKIGPWAFFRGHCFGRQRPLLLGNPFRKNAETRRNSTTNPFFLRRGCKLGIWGQSNVPHVHRGGNSIDPRKKKSASPPKSECRVATAYFHWLRTKLRRSARRPSLFRKSTL